MCGISGVLSPSERNQNILLREAVDSMNQTQFCRGPDDGGIFLDEQFGLVLGNRRLSIQDLSPAGHQPMGLIGTKLQITFNGEIYNFQELKKDLEGRGYHFKTKTDTEVILNLYKEYGPVAFPKLRGMFGLAIWDGDKEKLFLVKDRYGIKPLYYYSDERRLIFASTVKALEKSGLFEAKTHPGSLVGFLLFGSIPLPFTTLKNVFALLPGHYLVRNVDGSQKIIKYYDPLEPFFNKSGIYFKKAVLETKNLLKDSVKNHLISDAPLGVFLSGGVDSSLVAALASLDRGGEPITTLSVIFDETEFSEKIYQESVVQRIKSEHREIKITKKDFFDNYDSVFQAMDQPTIDGVNTFFISKAAKSAGLKVVLSGLGADEIFGGYDHFKRAKLIRRIQKMPAIFKSSLQLLALMGDRYTKLKYFENSDIFNFYLGIRGLFSPEEAAQVLNIELSEVHEFMKNYSLRFLPEEIQTSLESLDPVDLISFLELKFYLPNQLLKDTDFMSMYHSIETRVPFLDHKIVEYVSGLAPKFKTNKILLKASVTDLIPFEILARKKMGFTFPFQKWLNCGNIHWSRFWSREVLKKWY